MFIDADRIGVAKRLLWWVETHLLDIARCPFHLNRVRLRPRSIRARSDADLKPEIGRVIYRAHVGVWSEQGMGSHRVVGIL